MCCLAFSLLLNCTDLASMDDIFKVLIQIFSSENMTTDYLQAIDSFQKLIHERPKLRDEVIEILNKPKDFAYATTNDENNEHDDADPDADVDEQDTAKNSNENSNDDFLWRLCFANNSTRTFYYIDPFSALKTIQNNKLKIWSTFASNKSSSNTKWSLGVFKHSKQTDCYNCGAMGFIN